MQLPKSLLEEARTAFEEEQEGTYFGVCLWIKYHSEFHGKQGIMVAKRFGDILAKIARDESNGFFLDMCGYVMHHDYPRGASDRPTNRPLRVSLLTYMLDNEYYDKE